MLQAQMLSDQNLFLGLRGYRCKKISTLVSSMIHYYHLDNLKLKYPTAEQGAVRPKKLESKNLPCSGLNFFIGQTN